MLRFLADENFNADITRSLLFHQLALDLVRVQDVGLRTADDPTILAWAAANDRILLTHDRATMIEFACERIANQMPLPGLFVMDDRFPVGDAIREFSLICECSEHADWDGQVTFLPL